MRLYLRRSTSHRSCSIASMPQNSRHTLLQQLVHTRRVSRTVDSHRLLHHTLACQLPQLLLLPINMLRCQLIRTVACLQQQQRPNTALCQLTRSTAFNRSPTRQQHRTVQ